MGVKMPLNGPEVANSGLKGGRNGPGTAPGPLPRGSSHTGPTAARAARRDGQGQEFWDTSSPPPVILEVVGGIPPGADPAPPNSRAGGPDRASGMGQAPSPEEARTHSDPPGTSPGPGPASAQARNFAHFEPPAPHTRSRGSFRNRARVPPAAGSTGPRGGLLPALRPPATSCRPTEGPVPPPSLRAGRCGPRRAKRTVPSRVRSVGR